MEEVLFYGGPILTMDEENLRPEAVLVRDGIIAAVGTKEALLAEAPDAKQMDLQGKALLPGFMDAHSHIVQFSNTLRFVSLSGVKSREELTQRLQKFAKDSGVEPGGTVIGFGYDNNDLPGTQHPTREWLDEALPGYRVMVAHASGHMGCANTAMLKHLNISAQTEDPQGGHVGKDENGEPTGYLEETAFTFWAAQALGQQPSNNAQELLQKAQKTYFSYGITTAQDGLLKDYEFDLLDEAARAGTLKLDVVGYADIKDHSDLPEKHPEYCKRYQGHFKIGGYKLFLDGSPQGRTAWVTEPYENGDPDYRGYPIYTDEEVGGYVTKAQKDEMQLLCHCNGDAAAQQYLNAHKKPSTQRDVLIHAQLLRVDQLPQLKEKGIMPSFFVAHTWYWGDVHLKNFGRHRAENISPVASALELGIPYTFHMDTPVLPPDCIDSIFCAVNRVTKGGESLAKGQQVSVYDALKGITSYAAYQYHEEDSKGTITPGKRADLVVLSEDPTAVPTMQLRSVQVMQTYKDGALVYEKE